MIHPPHRKKKCEICGGKANRKANYRIHCSTRKKYLQQDRKISPRMLKLQCHMIINNIIYKTNLSLHFIKFLKTESYNYLVICMNTRN